VHLQHAPGEFRLDVLRVGLGRELEAALELAVETLVQAGCLLLLLLRLFALALDREPVDTRNKRA
jgi:hypothetical protein